MTVHAHSLERDVEHEEEESAMAAAAGPEKLTEELLVPSLPPIQLERILSASMMEEWWSLLRESVGTSKPSQLHWDILSFCKAYELTADQMQLRRDALMCVERAVHDIWPSAEVHLFGSIATGLALPWSDIDVAIIPPNQERDLTFQKPPTPLSWQNALCRNLNRLGQCRSLQPVPFAKVPILKAVFNSGIACDVSFDVRNSLAGVSVIRQFMEQYEACRPLCLVLKFFLGQNNLNELRAGGLGSFCIVTMVISHLQKMAAFEAGAAEGRDLGTLLLSFFAHYSNMHDYSTDVVSTRGTDCRSSKLDKGWVNLKHPRLLAVEDPLDATSDIAKGSYRIEEVRQKFSHAQRALLTHWYNANVLAQLVDLTANPTERPSPAKAKKRKRESRKRRRPACGQEGHNLPDQPALKIQRTHHPQQGSGLVTKRHLDSILANNGPSHLASLPKSQRLRTGGHDEEEVRSVQGISPKTPSPDGGDLLRRTQGNATLETSRLSPITSPRKCCTTHQAFPKEDCHPVHKAYLKVASEGSMDAGAVRANPSHCSGDSSRGRQDGLKRHAGSLEVNNSTTPKTNASNGSKSHAACPIQSARSQPFHSDVDGLGKRGDQVEELLLEFWESQLTARSKPRRTSRRQTQNCAQFRDLSTGQDSMRGGSQQSSETHNSVGVVQLRKGIGRSAHSRFSQGEDAERVRGNQDDKILEGFWESHVRTGLKPRKTSLNLCGSDGYNTPAQTAPIIHPERPLTGIKKLSNLQDGEKLPEQCGAENNNLLDQNGSKTVAEGQDAKSVNDRATESNNKQPEAVQALHPARPAAGQDDKSVEDGGPEGQDNKSIEERGTEGNNKQAQAVQACHSKRSQSCSTVHPQTEESRQKDGSGGNVEHFQAERVSRLGRSHKGSKIQLGPQDEKSDQPCKTGGNIGQDAPALQTINPNQSHNGSKTQASPQGDGKLVVDLDFWEAQLTTKRKPRSGSLINHSSRGAGKSARPALAVHRQQPLQCKDVVGGVQDKRRVLVDVLDPHLIPKPKVRSGSFPARDLRDRNEQPGRKFQEEILTEFWEAELAPRVKAQKNSVNSQRPPARPAKSLNSAKSASESDVTGGLRRMQTHHQPQQTDKDANGRRGDETLLVEFWEAELAPRLKAYKNLPRRLAAGCEVDHLQPIASHLEQQQPPQSSGEVPRVSPDERKLVEFWETYLNPTPRSKKCFLNNKQAEVEGDAEKPSLNEVGSIDYGYDRKLGDFWESHLTPSLKSRKGLLKHDVTAREEDIHPVVPKTLNGELPPALGNGFVSRSGDEAILSTFWEACLNPALFRKGYLRRKSTEVI